VTTASVGFYRTKLKSAPGSQQLTADTDDTMVKAAPAAPLARCQRRALPLSGPPGARRAA
jgi:hypothetical protein